MNPATVTLAFTSARDPSSPWSRTAVELQLREWHPQQLAQRAAQHITDGIGVDAALWARLCDIAKNVLVEATEESRRRGAGEGGGVA